MDDKRKSFAEAMREALEFVYLLFVSMTIYN